MVRISSSDNRPALPLLAITGGDPNGIGPEVALRALADPGVRRLCTPILVGPESVFRQTIASLRLPLRVIAFAEEPTREEIPLEGRWVPVYSPSGAPQSFPRPGAGSAESGRAAAAAIETAVRFAAAGVVDGIVTAPISKEALHRAGVPYPGHTEMLRHLTGASEVTMVLVTNGLRVGLVTIHVPLADVPRGVTTGGIVRRTSQVHGWLKGECRIREPRVAILALNPHAGEGGELGTEESTIIEPALRLLAQSGIDSRGPFPADAFFARYRPRDWDAVMAMYHDQGLIPLKSRARGQGVNITIGLPIVRTSPDHGTGFDIAGKGIADPSGMCEAIRVAVRLVRNRRSA